ncbi:MAG: nucleotidyl transferase AbiEii/AbiGii toxin family protein [Vulcanimicrobiaceae bacterium]
MPLLRDNRDDFLALVIAAAEARAYPPAWVEKDYWITEVLRSLAEPLDEYAVIFKGGTSLSKAWGLIQRMSQDVDILLVPPRGAGSNARDRALKALTRRAGSAIHAEPFLVTSSTGIHRATTIRYGPTFEDPIVPAEVLLEIGVRGGPDPNEPRAIHSFVAEYALGEAGVAMSEFDELRPVEIYCLKPERTLVEKLSALHHLATTALDNTGIRIGTSMRHYYDIAMLLRHDEIRKQLHMGVVPSIAEDVEARSAAAGWPYTPRPVAGYAASPAFSDAFLSREDVSGAYARVLDLVVGGLRPPLYAVAQEVRGSAALL